MKYLERYGKDSRMTVADVRKTAKEVNVIIFNEVDILQTILSEQLPPKHVNGITNLILMRRQNTTDYEIQNALVNSTGSTSFYNFFNNHIQLNQN